MIIHSVTDQFNLGGGIEHIFQVARGLKDFKFRIFGKPGEAIEKFKSLENVEIRDKGFDRQYVLEEKPDLVHIHHLRPLLELFKFPFSKKCHIPVIFTAHGLHIHKYEFYNSPRARLNYFMRFQLEKRLFRHPARVIAVSREDQSFLEQQYHLNNVTYLTNGIDFTPIQAAEAGQETKKTLRRRLGFKEDAFLFIIVARFDFQKGLDVFLKAVSILKQLPGTPDHSQIQFILVGDGAELDNMKKLSRELGIGEYLHFLGARRDVYDIMRAGDAFLLPSRWEGLPIVLLETGLLKLPVIASDTYGNREVIKSGNGILFKNLDSDALAAVIRDVTENKYDLENMAQNLSLEIHRNYSLEKMLAGLENIYKDQI